MKKLLILVFLTISFSNAKQPNIHNLEDCKKGKAYSCMQVGKVYSMDPKDPIMAEKYLAKACDMDVTLCHLIGSMYAYKLWVDQDYKKAYKYHLKGCNAPSSKESAEACYGLGNLYYFGNGVKQNYSFAWQRYSSSCDDKNGRACHAVGLMYAEGVYFKKNNPKASVYYKKACNAKYDVGCYNLGVFYYNGQGVRQSYSKAKEYFGQACDMGREEGCKAFSKLNKKGYQ